MDPVEYLQRSGGVAGPTLVRAVGRTTVRSALASGLIVRVGRGRFALPAVTGSLGVAHGRSGVLSHLSAARWWGWEVASPLDRVEVLVPRNRRAAQTPGVVLRRRDVRACDVAPPGVTAPLRTVLDVATDHPFPQALGVADAALRSRLVSRDELLAAAVSSPDRGHARKMKVVLACDPRAENQFESALRALALEAGLRVEPQVSLFTGDWWVRPDLLDEERGLALEAESFTWHGQRVQLMKDCRKYNDLALPGLVVVRFAGEHVMLESPYTRSVLEVGAGGRHPWLGVAAARPAA